MKNFDEFKVKLFSEEYGETYRFKEPIECERYPGYYHIPTKEDYVINCDGEIISLKKDLILKYGITKPNPARNITGGYYTHPLGRRHRLLMMTFTEYDFHPKERWVNHIDGVPGNDDLSNLEWVTPAENILHAYRNGLHPNKIAPVDLWNWITNEKRSYSSATVAAEDMGWSVRSFNNRLHSGDDVRHPDGWRVKHRDSEWKPLKKGFMAELMEIPCYGRNYLTGQLVRFDSYAQAAKYTGLSKEDIQPGCIRKYTRPKKGWVFRKIEDVETFPKYSDDIIKAIRKTYEDGEEILADYVLVFKDGEMILSGTVAKVAEILGHNPITFRKYVAYKPDALEGIYLQHVKWKSFK